MELLKLKNMGTKGLSTDEQPWELSPEFITHGNNFRVHAGALTTAGGFQHWATVTDQVTPAIANFHPGHLIHVGVTAGDYWLMCGRTKVVAFSGTVFTDVSSTAAYTGLGVDDELKWTSCRLGQIPLINNPQAHPEYWSPQSPGQKMQPLDFDGSNSWLDMGYSFEILRSHKNFLFAMNLQEGGIDFPDTYRWSHPADINGLPVTWDETDNSFLAGKAALGGDGGHIIDGQSIRDAFCIYSERAIDILDSTGDEFVWKRRELSSTVGLIARNCLAEVKGRHFLLTDGDIVMNDGTSIESIAHNRIRRRLTASMNVGKYHRSYAVRNDAKKEVWFCVVEEDADYPNVAYIYNWRDDSWAIRDIAQNIAHAGYGSQTDPSELWSDFLGTPSAPIDTWDTQQITWGSAELTPLDDTIIGCNPVTGSLYLLDPQGTPDEDIDTIIERTDFPLVDSRQVTSISRVFPHIRGTEPLEIQFGSQDYPGAAVRWKPPITFNPATDRKIDVRTTGELHCWSFRSIGKGNWQFSGMDIEWTPAGER